MQSGSLSQSAGGVTFAGGTTFNWNTLALDAAITGKVIDTASIPKPLDGATVFDNLEGDGHFHAGDPITQTDDAGTYIFTNLDPGMTHHIIVVPPAGYTTSVTQQDIYIQNETDLITANDFVLTRQGGCRRLRPSPIPAR